ncbi:MAG: hypothetical protein U0168_10475 [Nannocystaceae bacterium]
MNVAASAQLGGSARGCSARADGGVAAAGGIAPTRRHDILWGREPASLWVLAAPAA